MSPVALPTTGRSQRGAALVVALLILLALTLVGTATARMSLLEERMTGNAQDRNIAFQAAEAALRAAEGDLQAAVLPDFTGTDGRYQPADPDDDPVWKTVDWSDPDEVTPYDGLDDAPGVLSRATAAYIFEQLPRIPSPGESLSADAPVDEAAFFRITARGAGVSGNAVVTLQATYKR
jgi:type IV pilus assembly protein PilX